MIHNQQIADLRVEFMNKSKDLLSEQGSANYCGYFFR